MARPILTADQMRTAEQAVIDGGVSVDALMERAGIALAEAVHRFAGPRETLILCGPGNNGGDGYVAARRLRERGHEVRIAALSDPATAAAMDARSRWDGPIASLTTAAPAPVVIDCLFGTGLKRGLDDDVSARLCDLIGDADSAVACDLPSGVGADDGCLLSPVPQFDLTVTFGALKPAHRLMPALPLMGRVVLADIGLEVPSLWSELARPLLPPVRPDAHKYSRGLVHCIAGDMPGATTLAATAAARSGAGYVRVSSEVPLAGLPASVVQTNERSFDDPRIGCLLIGPGLGDRPDVLRDALATGRPMVIDADAIGLLGEADRLEGLDAVVTPHAGEFDRLFGAGSSAKPERALDAARRSGGVVVFKGPDTLVAAADGRLAFAPPAPPWLASAGTGDVLAGILAAFRARGMPAFDAACAAVWVHGRAAERAGPAMIADDLAAAIPNVLR